MTGGLLHPPIPAGLAHRPTIGGLVVPWVNVALADGGVDFRVAHHSRWGRCWRECICQTCGLRIDPLLTNIALLGGPDQLAAYFDEAPLHPWCARYVTRACPMVAGRMPRFADRQRVSEGNRGKVCPEPGCDCGGWRPHAGPGASSDRDGAPAHEWWLVLARSYALAATPRGVLLGGIPQDEVRRRLISSPTGR